MKHIYRKTFKMSYNNHLFQVIVREDKSVGFLKIIDNKGKESTYEYPSAQEFLHLSSLLDNNSIIKF